MSTTEADYKHLMDTLHMSLRHANLFLQGVSDQDLKDALSTIERAEAVGPIFHPSEWIKANKNKSLERQRILVEAARRIKGTIAQLQAMQTEAEHV